MEVMKGRMKNCYLQSSVKSERCYGEGEQRILKIATDSMGFFLSSCILLRQLY